MRHFFHHEVFFFLVEVADQLLGSIAVFQL